MGWSVTLALLALPALRPSLRWLGKGKGWVVLSGLLAFASPFAYEAIKAPCVPFLLKGCSIGGMVLGQTLLLLYGQRQTNNEQQAAEARLNAIGVEINIIGTAIQQQGSLLSRIADGIASEEEEEPNIEGPER
jgi:hypothetical protein